MKSLVLNGRIGEGKIEEIFLEFVDENRLKENFQLKDGSLFILAGSKYMFRTGDYVGFIVLSQYEDSQQIIKAMMLGGGRGVFNITWGAGSSIEGKFVERLKEVANKMSITYSIQD